MITRRVLMHSVSGLLLAQAVRAQSPAGGSQMVFEHDLPDMTLQRWSVTAVEVSYGPGESTPAHRHPGLTLAYVLEGAIRSQVGEAPEQTYTAGHMFLETPGQRHAVSRNASATQPAKLLAIMLAPKGQPRLTPAPE